MKRDALHLRAVCNFYLFHTKWAGELGDPIPESHRDRASAEGLREIRRERRVCHLVLGDVQP